MEAAETGIRRSPCTAFVLMPFGGAFDALFDKLIAPALQRAGYEVTRADNVIDQRNVLRDIVSGIDEAHLIVADLTGLNANVFYELGLAHALGIPTLLITQALDAIPFDLRGYRANEYSLRFDQAGDLAEQLEEVAVEHAGGNLEFGSPISDFLPRSPGAARLSNTTPCAAGEVPGEAAERREEPPRPEELGVAFAEALQSSTRINARVAAAYSRANAALTTVDRRVESSGVEAGSYAWQQRLGGARAAALDELRRELEEVLPDVEEANTTLIDAGLAHVSALDASDPTARRSLEQHRDGARSSVAAVSELLDAGAQLSETLEESRGAHVLDSAIDRFQVIIQRLVAEFSRSEAFWARVVEVAEDRLSDASQ